MSYQQSLPVSWYQNKFRLAYKHWSLGFDTLSAPVLEPLSKDSKAPIFLRAWSHLMLAFTTADDPEKAIDHANAAENLLQVIVEGPFSDPDKEETLQLTKDLIQFLQEDPDRTESDLNAIRASLDGKYKPDV